MTIIRPNSISGITSVTAKTTDQLKLFDVNGAWSHVRAGVITATKFVGPFDGTTADFSGDVTISGDLGVAGTVTYEDVARVDATGISTFREGFYVGPLTGIAATHYKDGSIRSTGIITATNVSVAQSVTANTYYGSGANLTGISVDTTKIETGNTKVETVDTGSDGHVKITTEGTERVRINATGNLGIGTDNPQCLLDLSKDISSGVNYVDIRNHHASGGAALRVKTQGTYGSPTYQAILGASDAGGTIRVGAVSNHPLIFLINNAEKAQITTAGHFIPPSSNSQDLGSVSKRWRDLYTQDLQLSNKSVEGGNDVDGTWGDYTIQEGENDLFLINNRNGKKYKFNLTEVN